MKIPTPEEVQERAELFRKLRAEGKPARIENDPWKPEHPGCGEVKVGLGDRVSAALSKIGVTPERVTDWLGRPCGCEERRERLNQLGEWAATTFTPEKAKERLGAILGYKPSGTCCDDSDTMLKT